MIQCFKMGTGVGVFRLKIYAYVNASKLLRCFCCLNSPVCFAYHYRPTTKVMVSVVSVCLFLGFPVLGPNRSPIHTPQQGPRLRYHPSPSTDMFKFVHYEARTVVSGRLAFDWNAFLFGYYNCVKDDRDRYNYAFNWNFMSCIYSWCTLHW